VPTVEAINGVLFEQKKAIPYNNKETNIAMGDKTSITPALVATHFPPLNFKKTG
jgi:hypothetical protein